MSSHADFRRGANVRGGAAGLMSYNRDCDRELRSTCKICRASHRRILARNNLFIYFSVTFPVKTHPIRKLKAWN